MKTIQIMEKAINDSDLNGYKWTANKNGLHWSYGVDFTLTIETDCFGETVVYIGDKNTDVYICVSVVNREKDDWLCDEYHDFVKTREDAIYWATRKIIAKANRLY